MRARAFHGALALAGLLAACEQERGDHCQRNSDCQDPLICVRNTRQCAPAGSTGDLDGSVIYDSAPYPDADLRDAGPRFDAAAPDAAAPDATLEFDAAAPDAAR